LEVGKIVGCLQLQQLLHIKHVFFPSRLCDFILFFIENDMLIM
jgi:hypothetical protein